MNAPPRIVDAVLLGGGHGRRAGGPKALRLVEGELAWRRQARLMRAWGCREVVAVLHPDAFADGPPPPLACGGVRAVRADPDAPMFASLQEGLRALRAPGAAAPDWILQLPVDCPWPGDAVADALLAKAAGLPPDDRRVGAIRPQHAPSGRHGHPLLLRTAASAELTWMDARFARLDRWLETMREGGVLSVPVQTEAILANHNR